MMFHLSVELENTAKLDKKTLYRGVFVTEFYSSYSIISYTACGTCFALTGVSLLTLKIYSKTLEHYKNDDVSALLD